MANKLVTDDLVNLENEVTAVTTINENFDAVETALDNTLSRDGSTPNQMETHLDMNGNRIINNPAPSSPTDLVRLQDLALTYITNTTLATTPVVGDANKLVRVNSLGTAYSFANILVDAFNNLTPLTNGNSALGSSTVGWSDLFLAAGGVVKFGATEQFIHDAGASAISSTANLIPTTNNAYALGSTTKGWADVFLGNGGVLNFNNGAAILGQNSNFLELSAGDGLNLKTGYLQFDERSVPFLPGANGIRAYAKDVGGITYIMSRDNAGVERRMTWTAAAKADMEAATSADLVVVPSLVKNCPFVPKAWALVNGGASPSILASGGISGISRPSQGLLTLTFNPAFSSANYAVIVTVERNVTTLGEAAVYHTTIRNATRTTTSVTLECIDNTTTTCLVADPASWSIMVIGDQ